MASSLITGGSLSRKLDSSQTARDIGLFLIRAALAAVFIYHGSQKLFGWFDGPGLEKAAGAFGSMGIPMPYASAVAAGSAEFFGAILLLVGLLVRPAALVMAFTMAVATYTHLPNGFGLPKGAEYALTLFIVLTALVLLGPGRIAIGRAFGR